MVHTPDMDDEEKIEHDDSRNVILNVYAHEGRAEAKFDRKKLEFSDTKLAWAMKNIRETLVLLGKYDTLGLGDKVGLALEDVLLVQKELAKFYNVQNGEKKSKTE